MNRKQRRAEMKAGQKNKQAPKEHNVTIDEAFKIATRHQHEGSLEKAERVYRSIIEAEPKHYLAMHNLAMIVKDQGFKEKALSLLLRAENANPDFAPVQNLLGGVFYELGIPENSQKAYLKAIKLDPDDPKFHLNLGNLYKANGVPDLAVQKYRDTLKLNPNDMKACLNLGAALIDLWRPEEALECFTKVSIAEPDYPEAHYNMGNAYRDIGEYEKAIPCYQKAIDLNPDYQDPWTNLTNVTHIQEHLKSPGIHSNELSISGLKPELVNHSNCLISKHSLLASRPQEAEESYDEVMEALTKDLPPIESSPRLEGLTTQTIGLLHFGRSGTGLMHSLIDNHPEISTLPSIFLSGYFNEGVWEQLIAEGREKLVEHFTRLFAVLFDATSPIPVPSTKNENLTMIGLKEGMTYLGENRDEVLKVDVEAFSAEANRLLALCEVIHAGLFLQIVHAAYEYAIGAETKKDIMYFHIHNPDMYAQFHFAHYFPDARQMIMVRSPVQCCESWMKKIQDEMNYEKNIARIQSMLSSLNRTLYNRQDVVGVRLEDVKERPTETMQALCKWMGVEESPTLYEMTAQGKKWWGDPSSPDYDQKKEMSPFDNTCLKRPAESIFNENDRFVLETLFYPFSVKFGYREEDPETFKSDLKKTRSLIGNLFKFENEFIDHKGFTAAQLQNRHEYLSFRIFLNDRLDVLEEFGTYPNLLRVRPKSLSV